MYRYTCIIYYIREYYYRDIMRTHIIPVFLIINSMY